MAPTSKSSAQSEVFANELPSVEIEAKPPYNIVLSDGTVLGHGERRVVPGEEAEAIVASRRAVYTAGAPRTPVAPDRPVQFMARWAIPASHQPRSGKTATVRIKHPFAFEFNGKILSAGETHEVPVEDVPMFANRAELVNTPKPRPPAAHKGPKHPIQVLGIPTPGCGIWSTTLQRHVEFGEQIEVSESEAEILCAMGRARSLRPEQPAPEAIELANLLVGEKDGTKHKKVVTLASRLLARAK